MEEDTRIDRIREFITPLRVAPGRDVDLGRDFDPAATGDFFSANWRPVEVGSGVVMPGWLGPRIAAQSL